MNYEYWQRRLLPGELHTQKEYEMLAEMGAQGWTLQMISQDASYFYFYFIREKVQAEKPTQFK
jgi:hypothetical protein